MQLEAAVFAKNSTTQIFAVSEQQVPIYQHYWHTQHDRFYILPPGISRKFQPAQSGLPYTELKRCSREKLGIATQTKLALLVGSGFKTKGVERALVALQYLQQQGMALQLIIIGEDKISTYIEKAKKLGVDTCVDFIGPKPNIEEYMWAADMLIHPAVRENTGNVIIEAMTAGLPVIASGICGYAHYVREAQAGTVLDEPFQQQQLNQAWLTMSTEENELMSKRGVEFGQTHQLYSRAEYAAELIEGCK